MRDGGCDTAEGFVTRAAARNKGRAAADITGISATRCSAGPLSASGPAERGDGKGASSPWEGRHGGSDTDQIRAQVPDEAHPVAAIITIHYYNPSRWKAAGSRHKGVCGERTQEQGDRGAGKGLGCASVVPHAPGHATRV
jgi:hypothetical protein